MAVAVLEALLRADSKRLRRDLRGARRDIRRFGRQANRDLSSATRGIAGPAAIATAALGGIGVMSIQVADELAKGARNAGFAADQYQRLAHVFDLAGTAEGALIKGIQKLAGTIYEAGRGGTTYVDALASIGLEYKDLAGLTPERQFFRVYQEMVRVQDLSKRLAVSTLVFGRAGRQMGSLFNLAAGDIEHAANRIDRLGGVMDERALGAAERLKDEYTVLARVLRVQLAEGAIAAMVSATDQLDENRLDELIKRAGESARTAGGVMIAAAEAAIKYRTEILSVLGALVALKVAAVGLGIGAAAITIGKLAAAMLKAAAAAAVLVAPFAIKGALLVGLVAVGVLLGRAIPANFERLATVGKNAATTIGLAWRVLGANIGAALSAAVLKGLSAIDSAASRINSLINRELIPRLDLSGAEKEAAKRARELTELQLDLAQAQNALAASFSNALSGISGSIAADLRTALDEFQSALTSLSGGVSGIGGIGIDDALATFRARVEAALDGLEVPPKLGADYDRLSTALDGVQVSTEKASRDFEGFLARLQAQIERGDGRLEGDILVDQGRDLGELAAEGIRAPLAAALSDPGQWSNLGDLLAGSLSRVFADALAGRLVENFITPILGSAFAGIFHQGGIVPGTPGATVPILAQAGELVLTEAQQRALLQSRGGVSVELTAVGDVTDATRRAVLGMGTEIAGLVANERLEHAT